MIVLDTDVLSEALLPSPSRTVLRWLDARPAGGFYTTAITQAEVLYGVEILPAGKWRGRLKAAVEALFVDTFRGRVLPFDEEAARIYPQIVAGRDRIGRPISQFDAVIASICRSQGAAIATRNTADFEHCGLSILNPWVE